MKGSRFMINHWLTEKNWATFKIIVIFFPAQIWTMIMEEICKYETLIQPVLLLEIYDYEWFRISNKMKELFLNRNL